MKAIIKKAICCLLLLLMVLSLVPFKPVTINAMRDVRNPVITEPLVEYNHSWENGSKYNETQMQKHERWIKSIFDSSDKVVYHDRLLGDMSKYTVMMTIAEYCVTQLELSPEAAFGILGNVMAECGFNPASMNENTVQEDEETGDEDLDNEEGEYSVWKGGAIGIVQWLHGRKENLVLTYPDWSENLGGQLQFLKYELFNNENNTYKAMKAPPPAGITDTADKIMYYAQTFNVLFERNHYNRQSLMKRAYFSYFIAENLNFQLTGGYAVSGIVDFDLATEVISPVSNFKITNGSILTTLPDQNTKRQQVNEEILLSTKNGVSTNNKSYSLYDRFGPRLEFINYYGEELVDIGLFDHVVSAVVEGKIELLEISDIFATYDTYLSGRVYEGRPQLLSNEQLHTGLHDARVDEFNRVKFGSRYAQITGTIPARIAESIFGFVSLLIGNTLYDTFHRVMNEKVYDNEFWKTTLTVIAYVFLAFGLCALIISLINYTRKYIIGHTSIGQILQRVGIGILAIALIFAALRFPKPMSNAIYTITTSIDKIFDTVLNDTSSNDDVVHSDDITNVREALIWKTAIFQPWCKGTFGAKYEKLYTQFDETKSSSQKLAMSYTPDHNAVSEDDKRKGFYDTASVVGDVVVDVGNGKQIRNWAALAWSTLSIYHIDETYYRLSPNALEVDKVYNPTEHQDGVFPNALRTADNKYYADTFRWIDAKMDVSPQYTIDGKSEVTIPNYATSKAFKTNYFAAGWEMLWKSILLLGLLPAIIKKLIAFAKLILTVIKGIMFGIKELFKEGSGLSDFWRELKENFVSYIYSSLQLFILIVLYNEFIDKDSFLFTVAYIIACFLIYSITPKNIFDGVRNISRQSRRLFSNKAA